MEDVTVEGSGPRAQRMLDEMEVRTQGLTRLSADRDGVMNRRVYRVDVTSHEEAIDRIRVGLGAHADEFRVA